MATTSDSHGNRNVLIIVENLPLPFDRRVWQEANALRTAGYGVFVICPKGKAGYREDHLVIDGINVYRHPLPIEARGALGYALEYATALWWENRLARRIYREHGFFALQACNPPDLIYLVARHFVRRHSVRFVFDHHDINPELYIAKFGRKDLFHRLMLYFERKTFELAHVSIATNESYRRIALERGGMAPENVTVVRSGPSLERLFHVPADPALKKGRCHLVCYVGVIGKQEGIHHLLRAIEYLVKAMDRTDIQFLIMGDGPELDRMKRLSHELGTEGFVDFPGRISDEYLRVALSSADLCVNPDEYNEMNDKSTMNKVMEYMAMGKPIVQFDLTEGRFSAREASLYAARNDAVDLAEKMKWVLDHPAEATRMGKCGEERIRNELEWKYEAPKYTGIYRRLLE